jgi:hypothetical protein
MTQPDGDPLITQGDTLLQKGIQDSGSMVPEWAPVYALACFVESIARSLNEIERVTVARWEVDQPTVQPL